MRRLHAELSGARIMVVDDQAATVRLLQHMLREEGFSSVRGITNPREALSTFHDFNPDLVILDLQMPGLDGFAVLAQLQHAIPSEQYLPVLMLTGKGTLEARQQALGMGANDFVDKPFHVSEVLLRIRNLLEARFLHLLLTDQKEVLRRQVDAKTQEALASHNEMLERLAQAAEFRNVDTGRHAQRVGELSAALAQEVGLPEDRVTLIRRAAPLHDLGKIGIPDRILLKPGPLTTEEFETMKTHTTIGADLLSGGRTALHQVAQQIALAHHERWDGHGYPGGMAGDAIPLEARIVAVADFFDALTHERPYRVARSVADVRAMLLKESSRAFEPALVESFLGCPATQP